MKSSSGARKKHDTRFKNYLYDLGYLIKEEALASKKERDQKSRNSRKFTFQEGRLAAFHYIIGLMQQQAEAFGIPLEELRLDDIDPDKDLL